MKTPRERLIEAKALSTADLQRKYDAGGFGEIRADVFAELQARKSAEEGTRSERSEVREDRALAIAEEANSIARRALRNSHWANSIAIIAAVIAASAIAFGK